MRKALTREAILDAAIEILDRDGLAALSMRRLGTAVGVEAMSLYHHVPNKEALLDGIHERVLLSLEPPRHARTWQAFVRHQAHALHRALRAHPNALPLFATRPAATPAAVDRLEHYLAVLARAGFAPDDALSIIQLVAQLVVGHVMWTTGVEIVDHDHDRELALGIEALLHGFARLVE
jgi:TetR/AcrR family transcriptional regulator, tetracycline repressor protein